MNKCAMLVSGCLAAGLIILGCAPARADEPSRNPLWTPLQLSLCPPVQFPDENCNVYGLSLGVIAVGIHTLDDHQRFLGQGADDVIGLQLCGLLACAREFCGIQVSGLGNNVQHAPFAVQAAGGFNYVDHELGFGLQVCAVWNRVESGAGLQAALVNEADDDWFGLQVGLFNWGGRKAVKQVEIGDIGSLGPQSVFNLVRHIYRQRGVEDLRGLQLGLVNKAGDMYGLQCGLLWNDAQCARGLQLGLVNVADAMTGVQIGLVNIIHESPLYGLPLINAHF